MDLATLKAAHPQWNLVDFKVAPNGGLWALGADGGVFSLDSGGGTAGAVAPFLGSYTSLDPAQRQGTRTFSRLDLNPSGGYNLISANQEQYNFNAAAPPNPVTTPPPVDTSSATQATGTSPAVGQSLSASATIHAVFDPLGLGTLADAALNYLNSTPGASPEYVTGVWLPQQDTYKQMFPEIAQAQAQVAKGQNVAIPSPAAIVSYRQTAQQMVNQGLIPPELASNDRVGKLILGGVSPTEFEHRVTTGYTLLNNADPATRDALLSYEGVDASHLVAHLIDPTFNDGDFQNSITRAKVGGAAVNAGYGGLSRDEAQTLAAQGQGTTGQFSQLAQENPLFSANVGESGNISRQEQLGSLTGNAAAISDIENRRKSRQALFGGGGGAAGGNRGEQGVGAATT